MGERWDIGLGAVGGEWWEVEVERWWGGGGGGGCGRVGGRWEVGGLRRERFLRLAQRAYEPP